MGTAKYTIEDWRAVRRALDAGGTIRGVAELTGVNRNSVLRWSRGGEPPERMWLMMRIDPDARPARPGGSPRARLTYEDRCVIFAMRQAGSTHARIAEAVGCHRSTVSRELVRMPEGRYDPRLAQRDAEAAARRPKGRRLERMVAGLPAELSRMLTWDQGSEMARASEFELATDFRVYFCDPRSPWQRPTNENTNGLVREFFPKGTEFSKVTDEAVARAQWLINNRPRKVLDWRMPAEVMQEVLAEGAMTT